MFVPPDISKKMGNCHGTVYGIFWLPNNISWSSVCGLTDLCVNWQHRQGNPRRFVATRQPFGSFVATLWASFFYFNSPRLVFCRSAVGPLATVYMPPRGPHNGLRPARHWHRLSATPVFSHRPSIFWSQRLANDPMMQISAAASINWAGRLPAAASALMAANKSRPSQANKSRLSPANPACNN